MSLIENGVAKAFSDFPIAQRSNASSAASQSGFQAAVPGHRWRLLRGTASKKVHPLNQAALRAFTESIQ
ncbi:hypothetical protein BT63DRAFT_428630 [Microthyrium microscopicum]|uniref:Uncharacterized protein n=1 Tax=Microthyrium microscopicum TaxID=703497 RepID=A0A6A6U0Q3_9PEZI|nr:hypothetical protein BT63DRAFT_428630 [Microthyrium microscopicum]